MNPKQDITEPLPEWIERIIDRALLKHQQTCPLQERVRRVEIRFAALLGYMVGSGLVGGITGALLADGVSWIR